MPADLCSNAKIEPSRIERVRAISRHFNALQARLRVLDYRDGRVASEGRSYFHQRTWRTRALREMERQDLEKQIETLLHKYPWLP